MNRYEQLLAGMPGGGYYLAKGQIIPEGITTLRLEAEPLRAFTVLINESVVQRLVTNTAGVGIFTYNYRSGEYVVQFRDNADNTRLEVYLTARTTALWHAAYASYYERRLDSQLAAVRDTLSLPRAVPPLIGPAFGKDLGWSGDAQWAPDAYRNSLIELRQAFRLYISRPAGWRQGVAAITGVDPLEVPRGLLNYFAPENDVESLLTHTTYVDTSDPFLSLNSTAYGWLLTPNVPVLSFPGPFAEVSPPQALRLQVLTILGAPIDITVTFLDVNGDPDTDTFAAMQATGIFYGTKDVVQVLSIVCSAATTGSIQLGLAESKFVKLVRASGVPVLSGGDITPDLILEGLDPDRVLRIDSNGFGPDYPLSYFVEGLETRRTVVLTGGTGRYPELQATTQRPTADQLVGFPRLFLGFDGLPPVAVTGGVTTQKPWAPIGEDGDPTTVELAALANQALARSTELGGTAWFMNAALTLPSAGDVITFYDMTDPDGRSIEILCTSGSHTAGANQLPLDVSSMDIETVTGLLCQILNAAPLALVANHALDIGPSNFQLWTTYATTAAPTDPASTPPLLVAGVWVDGGSSDYDSRVTVVSIGGQDSIRVTAGQAAGSIQAVPQASSLDEAFGYPAVLPPLQASFVVTGAAGGTREIPTDTSVWADFPTVELTGELISTDDTPITALNALSFPTALEVDFDPNWDGGDILVTGLDVNGVTVQELFPLPALEGFIVEQGSFARTADIDTDQIAIPGGFQATPNDWFIAEPGDVWFRILYLSGNNGLLDGAAYPPSSTTDVWQIIRRPVAVGSQLFASVLSVQNLDAGTNGDTARLRILGGVADYGRDFRVGRGEQVADTCTLDIPDDGYPDSGAVVVNAVVNGFAPLGHHLGGHLQLTGSAAWGSIGASNGVHTIVEVPAGQIGEADGIFKIAHGEGQKGIRFQGAANAGDYDDLVQETLDAVVFSAGEVVRVIGKTEDGLLLAEPLIWTKGADALIEDASQSAYAEGSEEGLDEYEFVVDTLYAPAGDADDDFSVIAQPLPDGWEILNGIASLAVQGMYDPVRLEITQTADFCILWHEVPAARWEGWRGWEIDVSFWIGQKIAADEEFRVWVDFGTTNYSETAELPLHINGSNPSQISWQGVVPTDASKLRIGLQPEEFTDEGVFVLERVTVSLLPPGGDWSGWESALDAGPARENAQTSFMYLWTWGPYNAEVTRPAPGGLDLVEHGALGLTKAHLGAGYLPERSGEGIIDGLTPVAAPWRRADISEYDADGLVVNLVGCLESTSWSNAELVGLVLEVETPERKSFLKPVGPSRLRGVPVSFASLAATLEVPSCYSDDGPANKSETLTSFPKPATAARAATLFEGEVPISTPQGLTDPWTGYAVYSITDGAAVVTLTSKVAGEGMNALSISLLEAGLDHPLYVRALVGGDLEVYLGMKLFAYWPEGSSAEILALAINTDPVVSQLFEAEASGTVTDPITTGAVIAQEVVADETSWGFTAPDALAITVANFNADSSYTLDYDRLIQATSASFQLPEGYEDFTWYVDASIYRRAQLTLLERPQTEILRFQTARVAGLQRAAKQDKLNCILMRDNGVQKTDVPNGLWSFQSNRSITIDSTQFDANSVYTFTYTSLVPDWNRVVDYTLEMRSGETEDLTGIDWRVVELDQTVALDGGSTQDWHQMRVTLYNVPDSDQVTILPALTDLQDSVARGDDFIQPPFAQELQLVFTRWNGGDVIVNGLTSSGASVSERFTPPVLAFTGTLNGAQRFATLTTVNHTATGVPNALGVSGSLRIDILHPTESVRIQSMGLRGVRRLTAPGITPRTESES